jgi:hypothetical protein
VTYKWAEMTPRERDALVAEKVMGWTKIWYNADSDDHPEADCANGLCPDGTYTSIPFFTTDISATWGVVEKMHQDGFLFDLSNSVGAGYIAQFYKGNYYVSGYIKSAPEAICIAALKVVGVDVE